MLQPLFHRAIFLGHIEFTIAPLHLGADPSLPDGSGNIMDRALGHDILMQEAGSQWPQLALTPHKIQESTADQSKPPICFYLGANN